MKVKCIKTPKGIYIGNGVNARIGDIVEVNDVIAERLLKTPWFEKFQPGPKKDKAIKAPKRNR